MQIEYKNGHRVYKKATDTVHLYTSLTLLELMIKSRAIPIY